MEAVLVTKNLSKSYPVGNERIHALQNIDIKVGAAQFVAVMGASGSGKSTLLHLLAGLTDATSGNVSINGTDISTLSDRKLTDFRRKNIGLIFQSFNLIPNLTGRENILLPTLLAPANDSEILKRLDLLVSKLGISESFERYPDTMSGGQQQRIAIARALISNPAIILADEPTGALDSVNSDKLCASLRDLCESLSTTVVMVTHNPIAAYAAKYIIILRDGKIADQFETNACRTVEELTIRYFQTVNSKTAEVTA